MRIGARERLQRHSGENKRLAARLARLLRSMFAALGLLIIIVTGSPLVSWWGTRLAGPWHEADGEVLIVLAGSALDDSILGESSYWRSVYAIRVYRQGRFREVILSGGSRKGVPTAESMRDFLVCHGIPRAIIRTEVRSLSTRENAVFTKQLMAGVSGRKVLLTSDYHMWRAHRAFTNVGLDVVPQPLPDALKRAGSWRGRWPAFLDLLLETAKIGYYSGRGWL